MLIVSNFHDFYDTISRLGVDKTCVYKRETVALPGEFDTGERFNRWPHGQEFVKGKKKYFTDPVVIGFCGKTYPAIAVSCGESLSLIDKKHVFFSSEDLYAFFVKEKISTKKSGGRFSWFGHHLSMLDRASVDNFFEGKIFKPMEKYFAKHHAPAFVYGRFTDAVPHTNGKEKLVLNPCLKDYRFFQVKDPQTAFQDVFMYISGVLGIDTPKMVKISDKELAKKRGHDGEYSFRKPPGKRGKNKWR